MSVLSYPYPPTRKEFEHVKDDMKELDVIVVEKLMFVDERCVNFNTMALCKIYSAMNAEEGA